jgi:dihydroxyacetone kinase
VSEVHLFSVIIMKLKKSEGIAGTCLVLKIAGALAATGYVSLVDDLTAVC